MALGVAGGDVVGQSRATTEYLHKLLPIFPDGQLQFFRERVDYSRTNTMQPARSLIDALGELPTRMGHGENDHRCREVVPLIEHGIKGHTASLVAHRDPAFAVNAHPDMLAKARHCFINSVVERLPNEMQQARSGTGAYVHSRAVPDGRNALQHLDI